MRILVICHAYPPIYSACSARWEVIAYSLVGLGHQVTIITEWKPGLAKAESAKGVQILRVGSYFGSDFRATVTRSRREAPTFLDNLQKKVVELFRRTWRFVCWPDHAWLWIRPAIKAVREELSHEYDAVISVSLPFSDHLIAMRATAGVGVPWIAEFGDPFSYLTDTPPNNASLYHKLNEWAENKVFKNVDFIVMPNFEMADLYRDNAVFVNKLQIIPHVVRDLTIGAPYMPESSGNKIELCYAGAFAKGVRTPHHMLAVIRRIIPELMARKYQVTFHIYGSLNDCQDSLDLVPNLIRTGAIVIHGVVSPDEAHRALISANVLVNVGNITDFRQPSKVFEYMARGKPILHFAPSKTDPTIAILSRYPSVYNIVRTESEIDDNGVHDIVRFIERAHPVEHGKVASLLAPHLGLSIATQFSQLVTRARRRKSTPM